VTSSPQQDARLRLACEHLAIANRILYAQGVFDAFGHVSMRHPEWSDCFLISRNRAPALVEPNDVYALDFHGDLVEQVQVPLYLERFIHAAIYACDPDVQSVVHSHSPTVVPFTVSRATTLRPLCHMTGFLAGRLPNFEIRAHRGEASDMLIRDAQLGKQLAACRAGAPVTLMRGHGVTITGNSLQEAVFRSIYTEKGARMQLQAHSLGAYECLTDAEASHAEQANRGQMTRAWDLWRWELRRQGLDIAASFGETTPRID